MTDRKIYNLSDKRDGLLWMMERGKRIESIRKALGATGDEFAEMIERRVKLMGLKTTLDKTQISRIEKGGLRATPEELYAIAAIDPDGHGLEWLILGPDRDQGMAGRRLKDLARRPRGQVDVKKDTDRHHRTDREA